MGIIAGMFLTISTVSQTSPAPAEIQSPELLPQPSATLPPPATAVSSQNSDRIIPTQTPAAPFPGMIFRNPDGLWAVEEWQLKKISPRPDSQLSPNGRYLTFLIDNDLILLERSTQETTKSNRQHRTILLLSTMARCSPQHLAS